MCQDSSDKRCHSTINRVCLVLQRTFRARSRLQDVPPWRRDRRHLGISEQRTVERFAVVLAYIWIVYLGSICMKERWVSIIHRRHRCDLSLFQLGMRLLEYFLNEDLPIPVAFHIFI